MMMSRKAFVLPGLLIGASLAFFLGPRPKASSAITPVDLPIDLNAYLEQREADVPDLRPALRKEILWHDPTLQNKTPLSIVYLHGFSASRYETSPLSENVAKSLGANLFLTRLRGHGRDADAMGEASANDWLNDAYEALQIGRRIGDRVILIGASTGATLATWLAAQKVASSDIAALVLMSPNFHPYKRSTQLILWPWGEYILQAVVGDYHEYTPATPESAQALTHRYSSRAIVSMMTLVDLVDGLDPRRMTVPTLFFYSPLDTVIDSEAVQKKFGEWGAPRKKLVVVRPDPGSPGNHVLAGRLSPTTTGPVARDILTFIGDHVAMAPQQPVNLSQDLSTVHKPPPPH